MERSTVRRGLAGMLMMIGLLGRGPLPSDAQPPDWTQLTTVQAADENWTVELVKRQLDPHPQGWYSPRYNQYTEATTAVARRQIHGTATFAWLIVPGRGWIPTSRVRLMSSAPTEVEVQFWVGGDDWWATVPLRGDQAP